MKNRQELIQYLQTGKKVKFLYFWGHTSKNKIADKSCLSQWFPASFTINAQEYTSAEQYMMAEKARLFSDDKILAQILQTKSAEKAKALGRQVTHYNQQQWDNNCFNIVKTGNIAKFDQNPQLKEYLLKTKKHILVEASPYDKVWGIGMQETHPNASKPEKWRGQNLLGFALMQARDLFKQNKTKDKK